MVRHGSQAAGAGIRFGMQRSDAEHADAQNEHDLEAAEIHCGRTSRLATDAAPLAPPPYSGPEWAREPIAMRLRRDATLALSNERRSADAVRP